jgi:hypothetical protein
MAEIPADMAPNWAGMDIDTLPVKFGQILKFEQDSFALNAIVLNFSKDEGGIWIGLCFIENNKLFGRQIPNGLINTTCLDLLDLAYLNLGGLKHYKITGELTVDRNNVGIGSDWPAENFNDLKNAFDFGIEQRKKKQTPCEKGLTDLNPVRECYFDMEKIIKAP